MEPLSFSRKEALCEHRFAMLPRIYHCNTPENHGTVFAGDADFVAGMCILGVCAKLYPAITIYTFQLVNNHIHLLLSGDEAMIREMFALFRSRLEKHFAAGGRHVDLHRFELKFSPVDSLDCFRDSIAYVNRDGYVRNDEVTPFSYRWGANPYYFQPLAKSYYGRCREMTKVMDLRECFHNKMPDRARGLFTLDGVVCPMSFCDIETGESAFRDAGHYFTSVAKNAGHYGGIASMIGESPL